MSIFKGINVLDLTLGPAGGLTSMVMADFGAKVIKEVMESAVDLEIHNKVDYESGKNWGDIH